MVYHGAPKVTVTRNDDMPIIHITSQHFDRYIARVRKRGARRYTLLPDRPIPLLAYLDLADAMAMNHDWTRGDVIGIEDMGYYEPTVLVEMSR